MARKKILITVTTYKKTQKASTAGSYSERTSGTGSYIQLITRITDGKFFVALSEQYYLQ